VQFLSKVAISSLGHETRPTGRRRAIESAQSKGFVTVVGMIVTGPAVPFFIGLQTVFG
jgi:hypothetical protein